MELNFTKNRHFFATVIFKFDSEDVRCVNQLSYGFVGYGQVGGYDATAVLDFNDFLSGLQCSFEGEFKRLSTIEYNGDFAGCTKIFRCFLAKIHTGFGGQFVGLHCVEKLKVVLLKIN